MNHKDKGWKNLGDWLGTKTVATFEREYLPFEAARTFTRNLRLRNRKEWELFCRGGMPEKGILPSVIPAAPHAKYAGKGWSGMGDWLGTGRVRNQDRVILPFRKARAFARSLGLKSSREWTAFCEGKLLDIGHPSINLPKAPQIKYANKGWSGWHDWLGKDKVVFLPFTQARKFARNLGLKSESEWRAFCRGKLPANIPRTPNEAYANKGWANMGDWLGTGYVATRHRVYRPFREARTFARSLCLKSESEWRAFRSGQLSEKGILPDDIPSNPDGTYRAIGWSGWPDWLGTGRSRKRKAINGET